MSSSQHARTSNRLGRRAPGQAIPLIALMIVVIIAMVGLSVDVGNSFSEERQAVAAANAASLAGLNTYIRRSGSTTVQSVYDTIRNTLNSNGVEIAAPDAAPTGDQLEMEAYFLDAEGKLLASGAEITNRSDPLPNNVSFVQVSLKGRVDTYFARVVGRDDLPIDSTAYAGHCPIGQGTYPIAVNAAYLDGNRFKDPGDTDPVDGETDYDWRIIGSGPLRGRTAMRVNVQGGGSSGGFTWLRWAEDRGAAGAAATSTRELEASLTIPGNIDALFEEAPWPNPNDPDRPVYPLEPGTINVGDYVYGSPGYKQSTDALMNIHINEGTRMRLPIYDEVIGGGANTQYRVSDFGLFVMLSHGQERGEKYIELAYLGSAVPQSTACSYSPAPDPTQTYDLFGEVSLRPEYAFVPTEQKPVQYVVVLDVSGSMSANFDGQCNSNPPFPQGRNYWQCANGPDGAPTVEKTGTGQYIYWNNQNERRIYVAKKAIESLVRSTNMPGNGGYDTSRPDDQMAFVWFNSTVAKSGNGNFRAFSSAPGTLITNINNAGAYNGDRYRTAGGTNGAAGLYRAALALSAAPKTVNFLGRSWEYKRVVIFITDGVSNQFLNKDADNLSAGGSTNSTYPSSHSCATTPLVAEVANCQITGTGSTGAGKYNGMDRPITQMGNVSKQELKGVEVFAIALSNVSETGLKDSVASFPESHFFSADRLEVVGGKTNVDNIMEAINTKVEAGLCQPRSDAMDNKDEYRATIPSTHYTSIPGLTPLYPTVGEVYLENVETGVSYTIPILAGSDGKLTYRKSDVPKGSYKLQPYVFYDHPLDPPTALPRLYSLIDTGAGAGNDSITVYVGPDASDTGSFNKEIRQDLKLRLAGDVCAQS